MVSLRLLFVLFAAFSASVLAKQGYYYNGFLSSVSYFDTGILAIPEASLPTFSGDVSAENCAVDASTTVPYQMLNVYESYGTYYRFNLMSTRDLYVLVYRGDFDPTNPCSYLHGGIYANDAGSPKGDFVIEMPADYYTVVVLSPVTLSDSSSSSGIFVVAWDPWMWNSSPFGTTGYSTCATGTSGLPYYAFDTQNSFYDHFGFEAYAVTSTEEILPATIAIVSERNGYFNASSSDCSTMLSSSATGRMVWRFQWNGNESIVLFGPPDTSTFLMSFDWNFPGAVFGHIDETSTLWEAPYVPTLTSTTTCSDDGRVVYAMPYYIYAEWGHYLIDVGTEDTNFDTAIAVYKGWYYPDASTNPCTDFVLAADVGDGGPVAVELAPWEYYTIVIFGYSGSSGNFSLYISSGYEVNFQTFYPTSVDDDVWVDEGEDDVGYSWSYSSSGNAAVVFIVIIVLLCVALCCFIIILIILICWLRRNSRPATRLGIIEMKIPTNEAAPGTPYYNPYAPPQGYPNQPGTVPPTIFSVNPAMAYAPPMTNPSTFVAPGISGQPGTVVKS